MKKLPAFQFYPADWRKDPGIQSLDYFDRGVWHEILCILHESPERGYLLMPDKSPMPDTILARILGLAVPKLQNSLKRIAFAGVSSRSEKGVLLNRRMVRDEELREVRSECGKLGADHGKKGGRPKGVNGKNETKETANETAKKPQDIKNSPYQENPPSSSSSTSVNTGEVKNTSPVRESKIRQPDPAWDLFADAYFAKYGVHYRPVANQRNGDAVQLAGLRKHLEIGPKETPPDWNQAVANYIATNQKTHTLADLCVNYATFRLAKLDRYDRPVEKKTEPGSVHEFL